MLTDDEKDSALCKIVEKLQKSSLFFEMKADLQVKLAPGILFKFGNTRRMIWGNHHHDALIWLNQLAVLLLPSPHLSGWDA